MFFSPYCLHGFPLIVSKFILFQALFTVLFTNVISIDPAFWAFCLVLLERPVPFPFRWAATYGPVCAAFFGAVPECPPNSRDLCCDLCRDLRGSFGVFFSSNNSLWIFGSVQSRCREICCIGIYIGIRWLPLWYDWSMTAVASILQDWLNRWDLHMLLMRSGSSASHLIIKSTSFIKVQPTELNPKRNNGW